MTPAPLLMAPLQVQIHAAAAIAALLLGAYILWHRKGTVLHRLLGRTWALLMFIVASSSWFINDLRLIGPFSPIHIFAVMTYIGLYDGISQIRRGNIARHRGAMQGLYTGALILAGAFTFLPGRRMHAMFFNPADAPSSLGWLASLVVIGIAMAIAGTSYWQLRNRA